MRYALIILLIISLGLFLASCLDKQPTIVRDHSPVNLTGNIVEVNLTGTPVKELELDSYALEYLRKFVKITTSKKVYSFGEEVVVTLENCGNKAVEISRSINPEISPLAVYKVVGDSKGAIVYRPKLGKILLKPGEKLTWKWDMKSFGELPGKYAIGFDYSDISIRVGDTSLGIHRMVFPALKKLRSHLQSSGLNPRVKVNFAL